MNAQPLCLALLLAFSSCGGSDPTELTDRGYAALRSGDYSAAAKLLDEALVALGTDPAQPSWMRAKMGAIEARTHTEPARAKDEFLQLAAANPSRVTDKDFSLIGGLLGESGKLDEAITVLTAGMEAHAESPSLKGLMGKLGDMAKSSGSAGALDALKGLGYAGGD